MRAVGLLLVVGLLLTAAAPFGHATSVPPRRVELAAAAPGPTVAEVPRPSTWAAPEVLLRNATYVPPAATSPRAGVPTSALLETPPVALPSTTPTVLQFANATSACCVEQVFTPPPGPFATVVLNYTGEAVGGVYDSSYRAYIDGVEVLFGTTPEYGRWFVEQNLSEYSSLFRGGVNLTFLLGAATTGGYFLTSVSLLFYPVAPGGRAPPSPDLVLPLWSREVVRPTTPTIYANASVPTNVTVAVLELYAYGFGADEFWWASPPSLRTIGVSVDGHPIAAFFPFPYVNTGGIDLFLWRPITSDFTLADRPYQVNLTGVLGELEGNHEFSANLSGITTGSDWLIGGALLLWTSAGTGPATLVSSAVGWPAATQVGSTQTASASFRFASSFPTSQGQENVSSSGSETFSASVSTATSGSTQWENVSQSSAFSQNTTASVGSAWRSDLAGYAFPISADLGSQFIPTSSSNGTTYGNFTTYMLNVHQGWVESRALWTNGSAQPERRGTFELTDELAGANGQFSGTGKTTGPNSFLVTGITSISSATTKEFFEAGSGALAAPSYSHLLAGSSWQPPAPYEAETVTANVVQDTPLPLSVGLTPSASIADVGQNLTLTGSAQGGSGGFRYAWNGLPPGCPLPTSNVVTCRPTAPGTYQVRFTVEDAADAVATTPPLVLVVEPDPVLTLSAAASTVDLGQNLSFALGVSGGFAPYRCVWYVDGQPQSPLGPCSPALAISPVATGTTQVNVSFVDAAGWRTDPPAVNASVVTPPVVSLFVTPASGVVRAGVPASLVAVVAGGVGPFSYAWDLDGASWSNGSGSNVTFVGLAAGTHSLSVTVRDSVGTLAASAPVTLQVEAATLPSAPSGATPSSSFPAWAGWAAVVAALAELALLGFVLLRRNGGSRPPPVSGARVRPPVPRPPG